MGNQMASDAVVVHPLTDSKYSIPGAEKGSEHSFANLNSWTIALDLKLNLRDETPEGHLGAERKGELLKNLEEDSIGKPLSFVVQVSHPDGANVSRYVIHDGAISSLPEPHVLDPSDLTADLVETASNLSPSKNLGLVIFSHGFGRHGIGADSGKQSLDSLGSTLGKTLSSLHRNSLDLLVFDGCSMAQVDTLEKMAALSKDVVAAPEYMTCRDTRSCGINLNSWLRELEKNPQMTGVELGDAAVADARREYRQLGPGVASPALTNFSLDQTYNRFKLALDNFSDSLSNALTETKNKAALRALSENVPEFERFYFLDPPYPPTKDLLSFAKDINQETQNAKLSDPGNKLKDASQELIQAQNSITSNYFGARQNTAFDVVTALNLKGLNPRAQTTYENLGGLSIAMPDADQIEFKLKQGGSYSQLVDSESVPELEKWREFLHALRE